MKYLFLFFTMAAGLFLIACSQGDGAQDGASQPASTRASTKPALERPTPTPEPVCDPGYVPAGPNSCCPADSPTPAWGDSCVSESQAGWAVDTVTHWFFDLAGLVPTEADLAMNQDVCTAKPDMTDRYWLVRCTDSGGEYLVHHDNGDVSAANDVAKEWVTYMTLVGLIRSQTASRTYQQWRLENDIRDLQREIDRLENCLQFGINCPP